MPQIRRIMMTLGGIGAACFVATLVLAQRDSQLPQRAEPAEPDRRAEWRVGRPRRMPLRSEFPTWVVDPEFEHDLLTFVRIQYDSAGPFGWWDRWDNDYPDSDWNLSFRLHELTSLKVAPNSKVMRITDPELFDYPFAYMAGVQSIRLSQQERAILRRYLLNGGFIMMDDFWADEGWANVRREMNGVFPDREPTELSLSHEIFHVVYDLQELPQVVDIHTWSGGYKFEHWHGGAASDELPHFWAYFDKNGRMMALLCHNNDLGDGWEREGENLDYFNEFSVKRSYPMGINVLIYVMTH
jgi:Domain of unknown function (DUF4159)